MKRDKPVQAVVSATEVRRHLGKILKRAHNDAEHLIVERDGFPLAVIIPFSDYEEIMRERGLKAFRVFSQKIGQEVEGKGITEEQLLEDLEATKKEVFQEEYENL